jgi:predicted membrane-bound spermidine synthase
MPYGALAERLRFDSREADAHSMRLAKLALATYLLLWTLAGLVGVFSGVGAYLLCRGSDQMSCTHDLVLGALSFVIGAVSGLGAYLLLRERWRQSRRRGPAIGLRPGVR